MKITKDKTIGELQTEFHEKFPGLKIEFYKEVHKTYAGSASKDLVPENTVVGDLADFSEDKEYILDANTSAGKIESDFSDLFNLNIQIFRKSKDLWLQTSATDDWTLEKQNSKGLHSMGIYE